MKVKCLVCTHDNGTDVSVHTTRELAVIAFQTTIHTWPDSEWRPSQDSDTRDKLEACVFFREHGHYAYNDNLSWFLTAELEIDDGTEPRT